MHQEEGQAAASVGAPGRLAGKTAYITGAGAGIGRAAALLFAREGAQVFIAEFNREGGQATAAAIASAGGQARHLHVDVTDEASVRASIDAVLEQAGRLDVLYNNAGGSTGADAQVTDCPVDEFWRAIRLDLFGSWIACKYGIAAMIRAGRGGSVINSTSVFALSGTRGKDAYTAAKGGVAAITRSMAVEYAPRGIRVNAVAPGVTRTERVQGLLRTQPEIINRTGERQLLGLVEPEHVAQAALYLASDESRSTTGQIFPLDGGFTIS
ncbi:SDR family NAD(P)-dependent oxidoreductase [Achromobacter xylosoxidans]|uniref:SDR family NAD(P)-dependent oxidoreductase n=1 Tax=Alcaligenes xylosoxydans xylosoxydans TaxID=85698 RepID=UPI0006696A89|nr:SDR family oxidoreductase [Achromobacter xylosoxidans]